MINDLEKLIAYITKLPGIGKRSAGRIALHLLQNKESLMKPLADSLSDTAEKIVKCEVCGNLDLNSPCYICTDEGRDSQTICVVENIADLWAMERSELYKGKYHILGGTLSAIDGIGPEDLRIDYMLSRIEKDNVGEVILATNATMDGQTTAHYIAQRVTEKNVKVTRLAHGIPLGGELDYLDEGTLSAALQARTGM